MDTSKIIRGVVSNGRYTVTAPIVKEDYGLYLQIEGVELPSTYEVDFSNSENNGTSVTMIGNADGVLIPSQFISTGKDVFAFLYHGGEDFGRTVYKFRIPNKVRPDRTNEEPTPEEQSVIDQTIAALNDAVERAEDAQQAIENMSVSATTLAEGSSATVTKTESEGVVHLTFGIPKGATGDTPNITASKVGDTTYIYADDVEIARIKDGTNGIDGTSPTASVTKSGKTATITITDKNGTTSTQVSDGTDGTDGISPTVTITPITGGHRITITDADGEHSADVMDGTGSVDDVQIDGTSIVEDGVANVPTASASRLGVVKASSIKGIFINSDGALSISEASSANVKNGTNVYKPITSHIEHEATFYGLAKASGDATQSASSNAVGNYTEDAKIAIQKMLGINQQGELIADITATEDVTEFLVTTDLNGLAFELRKIIVLFSANPSTTGARDSFYTHVFYKNQLGVNANTSCPSITYPTATSNLIARVTVDAFNDMPIIGTGAVASNDGSTTTMNTMIKTVIAKALTGFRIYQSGATKSLIPAGSNIKVYGIRS